MLINLCGEDACAYSEAAFHLTEWFGYILGGDLRSGDAIGEQVPGRSVTASGVRSRER
jgi:hypothetical protein